MSTLLHKITTFGHAITRAGKAGRELTTRLQQQRKTKAEEMPPCRLWAAQRYSAAIRKRESTWRSIGITEHDSNTPDFLSYSQSK